MCNEREDMVWFVHAGNDGDVKKSEIDTKAEIKKAVEDAFDRRRADYQGNLEYHDVIMTTNDTGYVSITSNLYSKDDHDNGGVGLKRKFDVTLVDTIDRVFGENWNLPEYLPFRECIKMGIQDGIEAGMKRASDKYDKLVADKNKQIADLESEVKRWKNAFRGLLKKCQDGVEAFDFISKIVHGSCGKKF